MIDRRTFLRTGLAGLGAATALSRLEGLPLLRAGEAGGAPSPAPGLYARALAIDTLAPDGPDFDPREAISAGLTAAVVDIRAYPRNFLGAIEGLADWNDAFRSPESKFLKVLRAANLVEAKRSGRLGIVLACQDASILDSSTGSVDDRNLRNLRLFHDLGMRVLQLTHNERNSIGDSFREKSDAGLSRLGEKVVAEMNALGMLVDLSHCGDRTTLEAIRLSTRPVAVTHAGCRSLHPTLRNKPDEVIRALAERGGYFGIYSMSLWLTERETTSVDDVLDHIGHVVKVGGIDLAGFGSDGPVLRNDTPPEVMLQGMQGYARRNLGLPGAETIPKHVLVQELNVPGRLLVLAEGLLRRGYGEGEVEKILGGNFARVFRDAVG
jgi:membrane dipeptidase